MTLVRDLLDQVGAGVRYSKVSVFGARHILASLRNTRGGPPLKIFPNTGNSPYSYSSSIPLLPERFLIFFRAEVFSCGLVCRRPTRTQEKLNAKKEVQKFFQALAPKV